MKLFRKNKKAFTLVELLAVVVVLGVLLLIAVPSVSTLINKSKKNVLLTEAEMYVNAAKLKVAEDGYQQRRYTYSIDDIPAEGSEEGQANTKFSGRIYAIKDENNEYKYSAFMINKETNEFIGNLKGVTPVLSGDNGEVMDSSQINLNVLDLNAHTYITSNGEKKGINAAGEVKTLASTFETNGKNKQVQIKYDTGYGLDDYANFYVINDVGDTITLLFVPSYGEHGTRKPRLDNQSLGKKYNEANEVINKFKEKFKDVVSDIRLLTTNDLSILLGNPIGERTYNNLKQYTNQNLKTLQTIFNHNALGGHINGPNLIIDELLNSNCRMRPSSEEEGNPSCYGVYLADSAVQRIQETNSSFNLRLVFEIPNENREHIILKRDYSNADNNEKLEIFNEVAESSEGQLN